MKLTYHAIFTPLEEQPGYCVTIPDLPGLVTQGANLIAAIDSATDAACGWILEELEQGYLIPRSSAIKAPSIAPNQFTSIILLDMDRYADQYGNKSVRKNCTIPAWLNVVAEKANINFSAVLQNALVKELHLDEELNLNK